MAAPAGTWPAAWAKVKSLTHITISGTGLSGALPKLEALPSQITELRLPNNKLSGMGILHWAATACRHPVLAAIL